MLALAIQHREALTRMICKTSDDPYFDNLHTEGYVNLVPDLKNDNWNRHQWVSLDSIYNIVGYLEASVRRPENYVENISIVNFVKGWNPTFYKDLKRFVIRLLFRYNYYKIVWNVVVGSPNEKIYDKFSTAYGGRVVGTFRDHKILQDGTIKSTKFYEMFRKDFEVNLKQLHPKQMEKLLL